MKLKFDRNHNVIIPTFILTARNGRQIGAIPAENIVFRDRLKALLLPRVESVLSDVGGD